MSLADERHHVLGPRLIDDALDQAGLADARLSLHDEHGRSATSESTELGHCQGDLVFPAHQRLRRHPHRVPHPSTAVQQTPWPRRARLWSLPIGEFSYPSHDFFSKKGVLLGLYLNSGLGDLLDRPIKDRVEHVLMHASKVHPQIRQEFESAYAVWWRKVKYNEGGYAAGRNPERRAKLSKVDNRIVVGSAAVTPHSEPDWQEGAISAGWQALKFIHERAMRG